MCDKGAHRTLSLSSPPSSWGERKGEGGSVRSHSAKKEDEEAVTQGTRAGSTSRYLTGCFKVPRAATLPGGPASAFLRMPAAHPVGAAQPRSPRPRDLHHVTRRISPVWPHGAGRKPLPLRVAARNKLRPVLHRWGNRGPLWLRPSGEPALPASFWPRPLGHTAHLDPRVLELHAGGFRSSGSASYQLCDLWQVTSPLSSLCHHLEMEQKCFLRRCTKNLNSLLSFLSFS